MFLKMKKQNKIIYFSIICILIISLASFAFAAEEENINEQMAQLKDIMNSSSTYSAFQTSMLLKSAQNLIDSGISFKDTKNIIENSVKKSFNAYNIKKVFDVILENQQEGLSSGSLINKVNEGLAKDVDNNAIVTAISTKAKNLKKANDILNEARQEGLEINGGEEIVEILADSLENDVPQESLCWLVKKGTAEGKSIKEISEIGEELSYLSLMAYDSGLSSEEIALLFKKATDNSSDIDNICENIQNSLEAETSTAAKIIGGEEKPSTNLNSGTLPDSSISTPSTEIGGTPTQEAGEAPTETGGAPEPSTPSEGEAPPPPPEN